VWPHHNQVSERLLRSAARLARIRRKHESGRVQDTLRNPLKRKGGDSSFQRLPCQSNPPPVPVVLHPACGGYSIVLEVIRK
jgi:hypothetical protein